MGPGGPGGTHIGGHGGTRLTAPPRFTQLRKKFSAGAPSPAASPVSESCEKPREAQDQRGLVIQLPPRGPNFCAPARRKASWKM